MAFPAPNVRATSDPLAAMCGSCAGASGEIGPRFTANSIPKRRENIWLFLKTYPKRKLKCSRIGDRSNLPEGRRRIGWVRTRAERAVQRNSVDMIQQIESFRDTFEAKPLPDRKGSTQPRVQVEEIETGSGVAIDKDAINSRARGGALNRSRSGADVEWQRRIVLQ